MTLSNISIPPVSSKFYNKLLQVFPPLSGLDVTKDTNLIELHRRAAQDEVLHYISKVVQHPVEDTQDKPSTVLERIKYVIQGD